MKSNGLTITDLRCCLTMTTKGLSKLLILITLCIAVSPVAQAQSPCYGATKAYITGAMNIRSGASTNSKIVGRANSGDVIQVKKSVRKSDYCWIQTKNYRWIAKTGRVQSHKPVASRPVSVSAPRTTCPTPPIHGSAELRRVVQNAF